jgi:hypothetical protein
MQRTVVISPFPKRDPASRSVSGFKAAWVICLLLSGFLVARPQRAWYVQHSPLLKETGSRSFPYHSIAGLENAGIRPGDTICLASGENFTGPLKLKWKDDRSGRGVVIISYGNARPAEINGGNGPAVELEGIRNAVIAGITLKGSGRKKGNQASGLSAVRCPGLKVRRVTATGFRHAGFQLYDCSKARLDSCEAFDNGFAGIHITGTPDRKSSRNVTINACLTYGNPGDPAILDNHSGNGILVSHSSGVLVTRSIAFDNGWDMPRIGNGPVGIWAWESDHVEISYCISYSNKTPFGAKDGGGFDFDGGVSFSTIHHCLSYLNHGAGFGIYQFASASPWHNNKIYRNISINDGNVTPGSASVLVWCNDIKWNQFTGLEFEWNTIINTEGKLLGYDPDSRHGLFTWRDNLFISGKPACFGDPGADLFIRNRLCSKDMMKWNGQPPEILSTRFTNGAADSCSRYNPLKLTSIKTIPDLLQLMNGR